MWKKYIACLTLCCIALAFIALRAYSQTQPPEKPDAAAEALKNAAAQVDQWFIRLNALDDWWITYDGREETDPVVDKLLELYDDDAYHEVQPNENQAGPVVFHGHDGIKKWATDFAKSHVGLSYRIDFMTRNEKPAQLFYTVRPPWGGAAVSVEFSAVYTNRQDRKRFLIPGSAFFLFNDAGKIERDRIYLLKDEMIEIEQ